MTRRDLAPRPGTSFEQAVQGIRREARQIVPSTVTTAFQGTARAYEASFQSRPSC